MKAKAWILSEGANFRLGEFDIPKRQPGQALVEPIYICWEANMSHAIAADPVDVCKYRNESSVVIGNAGVVRILEIDSPSDATLRPGQLCTFFALPSEGVYSAWPAYGYDAAGTIGLLAEKTLVLESQLRPIRDDSKLTLPEWAAFSLRYVTAWANWRVAHTVYGAMAPQSNQAPHVWAWGGGVSLALLQLARLAGFDTSMISSRDHKLELISASGIRPIDRRKFMHLDARNGHTQLYQQSENLFLQQVRDITNGNGVSIFADFIGTPVFPATLKALAVPGVMTTAGWLEGMDIHFNRAIACMRWQTHVHTHYGLRRDVDEAIAFAEAHAWRPTVRDQDIVPWERLSDTVSEYERGDSGYYPILQVNPL